MTPSGNPLRAVIAGLGRSGWNIHARVLQRAPGFHIAAVCDSDRTYREQAERELACPTFEDVDEMLRTVQADVAVVCTPNHLHAQHTLAALAARMHVVVEKPFALSIRDADAMIDTAAEAGLLLAPFQNRRFEHHFRKAQEICNSGILGQLLQIRMCWHGFTRRWDWQTLREFGGGALTNNGTHLLDQALQLFGPSEPEVFANFHRGLSAGDAEDHMKIVLTGHGCPTIDIELTNACAFPRERWHIMGTAGGLHGTTTELHWRWVDWSSMPQREVDTGPSAGRRYQNEDIDWQTRSWREPGDAAHPYDLFYENLLGALRGGGSLLVTPASARRYVQILEEHRATPASVGD